MTPARAARIARKNATACGSWNRRDLRHLKHSKTAEATRTLAALETGSKAFYQLDSDTSGSGTGPFVHEFPGSGGTTTNPTNIPLASKVSTAGTWTALTWIQLKFVMTDPQYYRYTYTGLPQAGVNAGYYALAEGDLDGNGVNSSFKLAGIGSPTGDAQRLSLAIVNEDE